MRLGTQRMESEAMGALSSMRRLVVGLVALVLCGGIAGLGYAREPVLIHVCENAPGNSIAFNFVAFAQNSDNLNQSRDANRT